MNVTSHDLLRGLIAGLPVFVVLLLNRWRRRRAKENAEISSVLRRRAD